VTNNPITIFAVGSRGDVEPYVALGLALRATDHRVRVATHPSFQELVTGNGLEFAPLERYPKRLLEGELLAAWERPRRVPATVIRDVRKIMEKVLDPFWDGFLEDCWQAGAGSGALLYSTLGFPAHDIGKCLGVPACPAFTTPATRTRGFPHPLFVTSRGARPSLVNYLSYPAAEALLWQAARSKLSAWRRRRLGLPRASVIPTTYREIKRDGRPVLYGFSSAIVPKPGEWAPQCHVTGYWFLEPLESWRPPTALGAFLGAGPPPIVMTFGSLKPKDGDARIRSVAEAIARAGKRTVLITTWGEVDAEGLPGEVFAVSEAPYSWLLPRACAVVHHGGAGTTAAAVRAGVPSVTTPFFGDQFFWAWRLAEAGLSPEPLTPERMAAGSLDAAIGAVLDDGPYRERSRAAAAAVGEERGAKCAAEVMDRYMAACPTAA
jgi:UDP:flavonoid glycosyltransferase YjiC (YdhE family)